MFEIQMLQTTRETKLKANINERNEQHKTEKKRKSI